MKSKKEHFHCLNFFSSHFNDFFHCKIITESVCCVSVGGWWVGGDHILGVRRTGRATDWEKHLSMALRNRPTPCSMPASLLFGAFLCS